MNTDEIKKRFCMIVSVSPEMVNVAEAYGFLVSDDYPVEDLVVRLFVREYVSKHKQVKYPKNWKEAIKERFFPHWLLSAFPVKYTVVKMIEDEND